MTKSTMRCLLVVAACCGPLVLAGCGDDGPRRAQPEVLVPIENPVPPPVSATSGSPTPTQRPATLIGTADIAGGKAVVDHGRFVLYVFARDTPAADGQAAVSACEQACAERWPPVIAPGGMPVGLPGIDPRALGTTARPDGSKQVTLAGRPLYRHVGDTTPGQFTGDGLDGQWSIARPG